MSLIKLAYFKDKKGHPIKGAIIGGTLGAMSGANQAATLIAMDDYVKRHNSKYIPATAERIMEVTKKLVGRKAIAGAAIGASVGALIRSKRKIGASPQSKEYKNGKEGLK